MAAAPEQQDRLAQMGELAVLREQPFVSRVRIFGPLIAAFRTAWNDVSTRWYVRPLAQQQSQFNQAAVDELAALRAENAALRAELTRVEEWLIGQDRDQSELRHDLGELAARVTPVVRHSATPGPDETSSAGAVDGRA